MKSTEELLQSGWELCRSRPRAYSGGKKDVATLYIAFAGDDKYYYHIHRDSGDSIIASACRYHSIAECISCADIEFNAWAGLKEIPEEREYIWEYCYHDRGHSVRVSPRTPKCDTTHKLHVSYADPNDTNGARHEYSFYGSLSDCFDRAFNCIYSRKNDENC